MATKPSPASGDEALEALREPFDEEQVQLVKGFSNVAPHHYTQKLIDSTAAYSTGAAYKGVILDTDRTPLAIVVEKTVSFEGREFGGIGAHPFPVRFDNESEDDYRDRVAYAVKSAHSDALKIALKDAGVGLDLYKNDHGKDEAEATPAPRASRPPSSTRQPATQEEEQPRPRARTSAPARPTTTREVKFTRGKYNNLAVSDPSIPDNYLTWTVENYESNKYNDPVIKAAEAELARRDETGENVKDEPREGGARKSPRRSGSRERVDNF